MTFDPNDTRLTAYALGELDGDDMAAIEAQLAVSEDSRKFVEEVREMARLLTQSYHAEEQSGPGLTPEHRQAIEAGLPPADAQMPEVELLPIAGKVAPPPRRTRWLALGSFALAASLMGATALVLLQSVETHSRATFGEIALNVPADAFKSAPAEPSARFFKAARSAPTSAPPFGRAKVAADSLSAAPAGKPTSYSNFAYKSAPAPAQVGGMMGMGSMGGMGGTAPGEVRGNSLMRDRSAQLGTDAQAKRQSVASQGRRLSTAAAQSNRSFQAMSGAYAGESLAKVSESELKRKASLDLAETPALNQKGESRMLSDQDKKQPAYRAAEPPRPLAAPAAAAAVASNPVPVGLKVGARDLASEAAVGAGRSEVQNLFAKQGQPIQVERGQVAQTSQSPKDQAGKPGQGPPLPPQNPGAAQPAQNSAPGGGGIGGMMGGGQTGNQAPVVVGMGGPGAGNFTPNQNIPFTQGNRPLVQNGDVQAAPESAPQPPAPAAEMRTESSIVNVSMT